MTLKELVANCVAFVVEGEDNINNLTVLEFKDSANYKSFINNAIPEINRAIQEITPYKKFQLKQYIIEVTTINNDNAHMIIELPSDVLKEIYSIYKIEFIDDYGNITFLEYRKEGKKIRIVNLRKTGEIYIRYYPKIRLLTEADYTYYTDLEETDRSIDLEELGIEDNIAVAVIPYLVKSKLWQEIEPELAQVCKTEGLQNLALMEDGDFDEPYQTNVFSNESW
jgi:hypothetical protein|nr:MAG TPA: hypothetical protein [Caudoviricetes sp.]